MKTGIHPAAIVVATACAASLAWAADPNEQLGRDLVEIRDGRFVYDELSICHFNLPSGPSKKFQVRSRATAPAKRVISRDIFVATVTATERALALNMAEQAMGIQTAAKALNALDCDSLEKPIGAVDLEVNTTMTDEGMQVEVTSTATGKVHRSTRTWEEIYE